MSYDADFVIDADTDEITEDENSALELDIVEKVGSKKHRVSARRRIEDILSEKAYKELYGDIYEEEGT